MTTINTVTLAKMNQIQMPEIGKLKFMQVETSSLGEMPKFTEIAGSLKSRFQQLKTFSIEKINERTDARLKDWRSMIDRFSSFFKERR